MTTLNAKANAAYNALIEQVERDNPGDVWAGFDDERDAYEAGWEDGHEARPVVDREAVASRLFAHDQNALGSTMTWKECGPLRRFAYIERAQAVLALLNGAD